jgi:membrane-associated protease RseP (regulator of RpoE activity)
MHVILLILAVVFVFSTLVGVHELGHYVIACLLGLKSHLPKVHWLIDPGPYVEMAFDGIQNAWQDACLSLGGPAFGGLAAIFVLLITHALHSTVLPYAAWIAIPNNLFQLLPLHEPQLDGRAVLEAIGFLRTPHADPKFYAISSTKKWLLAVMLSCEVAVLTTACFVLFPGL